MREEDSERTNDSDVVLGSLELPERNVNGDTTLTLGLELVKNPCVLEGTLSELGGFLSWLLATVAGMGKLDVRHGVAVGELRMRASASA
jgi:hypothetical protein